MSAAAPTDAPERGPAAEREALASAMATLDAAGLAPGAARDLAALFLAATLDGVTPAAPLPPGPKLFLANHQIALDLLYAAAWLNGPGCAPTRIVAWDGLVGAHPGELLLRLSQLALAESAMSAWLEPHLLDTRDPAAFARLLGETTRAGGAGESLVLATEGLRQQSDRQPVSRVGTAFVDAAIAAGMPVVPLRFAWAVPERPCGRRLAWPHHLAPMHVFLGAAIPPGELAALPLGARRDRIAGAINALWRPAPPGHRERGAARAVRVGRLQASLGLSQSKALAIDLLLTAPAGALSPAGETLARALPDRAHPLWGGRTPLSDFLRYVSDGHATFYPVVHTLYADVLGHGKPAP